MKKYIRAEVSPEFQQAVKDIARARIQTFADEVKYASPRMSSTIRARKAPVVAKLATLRTVEGFDMELTRLRSLDFSLFDVVEHQYQNYFDDPATRIFLHGKTRDIIMVQWNGDRTPSSSAPRWNMGPYDIYFDLEGLKNGNITLCHFVPQRETMTTYRHPHHKAYNGLVAKGNPLNMDPNTCWGSFGAVVSDCAKNGDVVELFRSIHAYLSRYNSHSPLGGGVEYCNFRREVH